MMSAREAGKTLGTERVAVVTALSLVFDFAGRASTHRDLRRRFYDLLARAEIGGDAVAIQSEMTKLYAEEPPVSWAVNAVAHNTAARNLFGDDAKLVEIGWWARNTARIYPCIG